jgi:PilZ domain
MKQKPAKPEERRGIRRFTISAPLTVILGDREIAAYTRDLSNSGMYFYMSSVDSSLIDKDFEFLVELPPDITLSTSCRIQGHGRIVRKEKSSRNLTGMGVAAEILNYAILKADAIKSLRS